MSVNLWMLEELLDINKAIAELRDKLTQAYVTADRLGLPQLHTSIGTYRDSFYDEDIDRGVELLVKQYVEGEIA